MQSQLEVQGGKGEHLQLKDARHVGVVGADGFDVPQVEGADVDEYLDPARRTMVALEPGGNGA